MKRGNSFEFSFTQHSASPASSPFGDFAEFGVNLSHLKTVARRAGGRGGVKPADG